MLSGQFLFFFILLILIQWCYYTQRSAPLQKNVIMPRSVSFAWPRKKKKKNRLFKTCLNINHTGIFRRRRRAAEEEGEGAKVTHSKKNESLTDVTINYALDQWFN